MTKACPMPVICAATELCCHSASNRTRACTTRKKKYPCRLGCGQSYTTGGYRDKHEKRWCSKSDQKEALINKEKEDGTYQRELERVSTASDKKKDRYSRMVEDPKSLTAMACTKCDFKTATEEDLKSHTDSAHAEQDRIKARHSTKYPEFPEQCKKCPYFGRNIYIHDRDQHDPNLPHGCEHCGYRALTPMAINMHMAKVHTVKKYRCTLGCGKSFKDGWYLKRHEERVCPFSSTKEEWKKRDEDSGKTAKFLNACYEGRKNRMEQYKKLRKIHS